MEMDYSKEIEFKPGEASIKLKAGETRERVLTVRENADGLKISAQDIYAPPKNAYIDREQWSPCSRCKYEEEEIRIYYPAEFDGGMAYEYGEAKFCPECGRPLTEGAWVELENKLKRERD